MRASNENVSVRLSNIKLQFRLTFRETQYPELTFYDVSNGPVVSALEDTQGNLRHSSIYGSRNIKIFHFITK